MWRQRLTQRGYLEDDEQSKCFFELYRPEGRSLDSVQDPIFGRITWGCTRNLHLLRFTLRFPQRSFPDGLVHALVLTDNK